MQININDSFVENRVPPQNPSSGNNGTPTVEPEARPALEPRLEQRIEKVSSLLAEHGISLKFSTDSTTNAVVVEMVDEKTGEAIRQFPSEVSLKLAANFIKLQGNFIDMSN